MKLKLCTLIAVALGAICSATTTWAEQAFSAEALVEQYYSRFQKPGFFAEDLMQYYTDNVSFTDPTFEIVAKGKHELQRLYADLGTNRTAYRDIRWAIHDVISQNEFIVIRGNWSGKFHQCDFDIEFMTLWRLTGDKIAMQKDFFAASAFDKQVGWDGKTATCKAQ